MKKVYGRIPLERPVHRLSKSDALAVGLLLGVVIGVIIAAIVLS
jgi:tetrahydromethanopterin S-methyltransferase subunit G